MLTPVLTLIRGGDVYGPAPLGRRDVLLVGERVARIGVVDGAALRATGLPLREIDADEGLVIPGLIDPHAHLIGAGGEQGYASRTGEVPFEELASAGVTTVVGCLGTDTVTRHPSTLLAKVRQLRHEGIAAYLYTGGFPVPPPTLTGSVLNDLVLVDEVIGVGEIAVADVRSSEPTLDALARLASEALVGGSLTGKAGVVHFHVGEGEARLAQLHALLDRHVVPARHLYPTHLNRTDALLDDGIALARRGSFVDVDTVEGDGARWLGKFLGRGGPPDRLTLSSDAHTPGGNHANLHGALAAAVREEGLPLERVLPCFTLNAARAVNLDAKGQLTEGSDGDAVVLERDTLAVRHVVARGRPIVAEGRATRSE